MAISVDDRETQKRFKEENQLPYVVLSDAGGKVAGQYGGTMPVVGVAKRATFVVAEDGTVKEVVTGSDAIDPSGAVTSCPVRRKAG